MFPWRERRVQAYTRDIGKAKPATAISTEALAQGPRRLAVARFEEKANRMLPPGAGLDRDVTMTLENTERADLRRDFVLQEIQPGLLGLMDGSVSTLAPIFAAAGLTGRPLSAFFVGLAASLGAAISMGLSEALSDDGSVTGRGGPLRRGAITGVATGIGGMLHTLPFLIPDLGTALKLAYVVVLFELIAIAFIRYHFMGGKLANTIVQVIIGGGIVFGIGVWLGRIGAS
jgi:hypothetical protein